MAEIGAPVTIQNTDEGRWLVTSNDATTSTAGESVSFTVSIPRGGKSVGAVQKEAFQRAIEMLQTVVNNMP